MHEVLVNRLGGLSLPRKSVVRLTDRPDMTLDVYRGRKTTIQQMPWKKKYETGTNRKKYETGTNKTPCSMYFCDIAYRERFTKMSIFMSDIKVVINQAFGYKFDRISSRNREVIEV